MGHFVISFSIASALTSIFAFRYAASRRPLLLLGYFSGFLAIEWAAEASVLPAGALPLEVAYVCLDITILFVIASVLRDRLSDGTPDEG